MFHPAGSVPCRVESSGGVARSLVRDAAVGGGSVRMQIMHRFEPSRLCSSIPPDRGPPSDLEDWGECGSRSPCLEWVRRFASAGDAATRFKGIVRRQPSSDGQMVQLLVLAMAEAGLSMEATGPCSVEEAVGIWVSWLSALDIGAAQEF